MNNLLFILLLSWGATGSPAASIRQLEKFTVYLETHYENWDNDEWKEASSSYGIVKNDLKKFTFTDDQSAEIGRYKGRCTVVFSKHKVDNMGNSTVKAINKIGGFFEGLGEGLEKK